MWLRLETYIDSFSYVHSEEAEPKWQYGYYIYGHRKGRQECSYLFSYSCSVACIWAKTLTGAFNLLPVGQISNFCRHHIREGKLKVEKWNQKPVLGPWEAWMAADLRGTARTLYTGFFYKGSQMALPWVTPLHMGNIHPSQLCWLRNFMMTTFFSQCEGSCVLSHLFHMQCGGEVCPWADVPTASQQRQGRWLQWQWLLFCPLYIFFRFPIFKPPSVPLDLHKPSSRQWLQGPWVSSTPAVLRAKGGARQQSQGTVSNFNIRPSCLQSMQLPPKTPEEECFAQWYLPPPQPFVQGTSLPSALCSPKQSGYNLSPCLLPNTAHLE